MLLLLVMLGLSAYVIDRAVAAPDLGGTVRGPNHGNDELGIAATLAPQLAAGLIVQAHAVITLSEHDLSVVAAQNNPKPAEFRNISARVRDGLLVISGDVSVGPFTPAAVAHVEITFDNNGGHATFNAHVTDVGLGQLTLPGWLRDRYTSQVMQSAQLTPLFAGNSALKEAAANIECVTVADDGVRIGVHRPGTTPDPSVCGF